MAGRKGGFDYFEFQALLNQYEGAQAQFEAWMRKFLKRRALEALALTIENTPVGKSTKTHTGGLLRSRWKVSDVTKSGGELVVYLVNNVEYASYVEIGHTVHRKEENGGDYWWEGYHMAEIAVLEVLEAMPQKFQAEFTQWFASLAEKK